MASVRRFSNQSRVSLRVGAAFILSAVTAIRSLFIDGRRDPGGNWSACSSMIQVPSKEFHMTRDQRSGTRLGLSICGGASRRTCSSTTLQPGVSDHQSKVSKHIPPRSFALRRTQTTKLFDFLINSSRSDNPSPSVFPYQLCSDKVLLGKKLHKLLHNLNSG